jgi:CheY-like chemotaxis protein
MRQRSLLIVDDDPVLTELFRLEGYGVLTAADGLDALQFLAAEVAPDLVILDMHMEGLGGADFAAELRALELRYPLLLVTADPDPAACARTVGADAWLAKPFALTHLLAAVERLLAVPTTANLAG